MKLTPRSTERKYWKNGHDVRGKDFHTFAASTKNYGFMFSFGFSTRYINIQLFHLTPEIKPFDKFVYQPYSGTIRTVPENYWIATVKDGEITFNSWDQAIIGRYSRFQIIKLWRSGKIPTEQLTK
jgi:hypothetical protein